jgi:transcriptional regulator with XRE-family HTH domain
MDANMAKNVGRAKLVKKERIERAWSQGHLAIVARVSLRTIQRLEKDGATSFETLMAVAGAFDLDVKQLNPTPRTQEKASVQRKVYLMEQINFRLNTMRLMTKEP